MHYYLLRFGFVGLVTFFLVSAFSSRGQALTEKSPSADSISLSLDSAENHFLGKNYMLLAQRYQVEAAKALIIQARLWSNPNINASTLILRGLKYFDLSSRGEQTYQISQLISIAGKKRNGVKVAKLNTLVAEDQFYDLIRTLKSQLRTDFYIIYYNQQSLGMYGDEIQALSKTIVAYNALLLKGYIARKELLRIQAQLFALQNELIALKAQVNQTEADLNILLGENGKYYLPTVDTGRLNAIAIHQYTLEQLNDTAIKNRYDLKQAAATSASSKYNLKLQRSLAVPDPTIGYGFDRNGSLVPSSRFLTLGIDIPIFNRNQGNIKNASFTMKSNDLLWVNQEKIVEADVYRAYSAAVENEKLDKSFDPLFAKNYNTLVQEVLKNYQRRNIGLLEFLDYYDSFKQNVLQLNTLKLNRILSYVQINAAVGKDVIK